MNKEQLPKTLYVFRDGGDLEDDQWLSAQENLRDCATMQEVRTVGVYVLQEVKRVSIEVKEELIVHAPPK